MKKLSLLILLAVLFPLLLTSAEAEVIVTERVKYFSVTGKTTKQVHAKFGRRGSWSMRRKHAMAEIRREFEFKNFRFAERGNKCVLTGVDIHLSLTYYYPRWINKKKASKKSQKLWASFLKELVRHEETHGKYFKQTMRQFERELLKTTGELSNDCRGMNEMAQRRLDKAYEKGEARHDAFDRREKRPTTKLRKLERALYKAN